MKKNQFKTILFCCLAALLFTSCNNDDDSGLTPEQKVAAFGMVKGPHTGSMFYSAENPNDPKDLVDTLAINWTIRTDSTMTISQFRASVIAESVTDTDLKEALENAEPRDLDCKIDFFSLNPVAFYINPITPSYQLTYGGATHQVQIAFYVNSYVSQGNYQPSTQMMSMQIVAGGIFVDGKQTDVLKSGVPLVFMAEKKS